MKKVYFDRLGESGTISGVESNSMVSGEIRQDEIGVFEDHIADAYIEAGLGFEVIDGDAEIESKVKKKGLLKKKRLEVMNEEMSKIKSKGTSSDTEGGGY